MPELPEVETTGRGIAPHIEGRAVTRVILREPRLRWPVSQEMVAALPGQTLGRVTRRAKYLIVDTSAGNWLLLHLGMSGRLRVVPADTPAGRHDHLDIVVESGQCLRYTDPRRFGSVLWLGEPPERHPLLRDLGPEPLGDAFDGALLYRRSRGRSVAVKQFLMDSKVVVGVGNIYANEALHIAGISPVRAAGRVSRARYDALAAAVREVLADAIRRGGTTLRDYSNAHGEQGFFQLELRVYGRSGEPCPVCGEAVRQRVIGQRSTFWCAGCQK